MARRNRPSAMEQMREGQEYVRDFGSSPPDLPKASAPVVHPEPLPEEIAEARDVWSVVQMARPDSAAQRYRKHQSALRNLEDEKLHRLQIMKWAQETRARFLRLSLADRKLFLEVLMADENQAFSKLFALQSELEASGVNDEELKLLDAWEKEQKPGALIGDCVQGARKAIKQQKKLRQQRATLELPPAEPPALPPVKLSLPGATCE